MALVVGGTTTFTLEFKAKMIVLHQTVSDENRQAAQIHLDEIVQTLSKPGGFAKLTTVQRKFLLGIVLAAIVPADKRIRNVELDRLQVLLKTSLNINGNIALESLSLARARSASMTIWCPLPRPCPTCSALKTAATSSPPVGTGPVRQRTAQLRRAAGLQGR